MIKYSCSTSQSAVLTAIFLSSCKDILGPQHKSLQIIICIVLNPFTEYLKFPHFLKPHFLLRTLKRILEKSH
jgi:hypothetical protein